jgi:hypothetical protein
VAKKDRRRIIEGLSAKSKVFCGYPPDKRLIEGAALEIVKNYSFYIQPLPYWQQSITRFLASKFIPLQNSVTIL